MEFSHHSSSQDLNRTEFELMLLSPADFDEYESFVAHYSDVLIYYSIKYKRFLEEILQCQPRYWLARDRKGRIAGVLPLMKSRPSNDGRTVLNSLPFYGSHGGPLALTQSAASVLLAKYIEELNADDVAAGTLVEHALHQITEEVPTTFIDTRISQVTNIRHSTEELFSIFEQSAQRNIRKAQREGVEILVDSQAMAFLQRVHYENMDSIGGQKKPKKFFELLPSVFAADSDYKIYLAKLGDSPVAALLLLYYGNTVEYYMPVIEHEARTFQPLSLIIFHAMCQARDHGFERWNWGGTWPSQLGVYRFKRKFGAQERHYKYLIQICDEHLLVQRPSVLLDAFPNFFVVPFDKLNVQRGTYKRGVG